MPGNSGPPKAAEIGRPEQIREEIVNRLKKYWWLIVLVVFGFGAGGAFMWVSDVAAPMPEALAALVSDTAVTVTTDPWYVFQPAGQQPTTGFIFYPGGKVDPRAYAPAARAIAEAGYLAVITPMPLNLAVISPSEAEGVVQAFPEIQHWVIGGHSLGGSMAAKYVFDRPGSMAGVVFWASYPAGSNSLADRDLLISSISGTLDGLATPEKIEASRPLLPANTTWLPIEGGNHAQFGWYGPQSGDNPATISRESQQEQAIAATLAVLETASQP